MKDVEAWGLGGERAEKLGILIRWIKTQLVLYERVRKESLAPPRYTSRVRLFLAGLACFRGCVIRWLV